MKTLLLFFFFSVTSRSAQSNFSLNDRIATALLAAPPEFRADATVKGYNADGSFSTLHTGSNNMICLADDPRKKGFNVAAYHIDLEPFMARGRELRAEGKSGSEVFNIRGEEAKNGKLKMPKGGATLHILYGPTGNIDPKSGKVTNHKTHIRKKGKKTDLQYYASPANLIWLQGKKRKWI